jgi:lipopolysaccharide/colanic/teichoic acid biosynthesis glycosyltransferase
MPHLGGLPMISWTKRCMDLVCLAIALPLLIPVMLAIAIYVRLVSTGPIFYRQERVGVHERHFQMFKFRSMLANADTAVHEDHTTRLFRNNLPLTKIDENGDARWIPLGGLFRSSGLDELPQVFNVLRGEMSLVGPRPCTRYEHALLLAEHKARFDVLPGITGLWQVTGKNRTTFQEMIALDCAYARQRSIWLDVRILLRTVPVVLRQVCDVVERRWRVKRLAKTRSRPLLPHG